MTEFNETPESRSDAIAAKIKAEVEKQEAKSDLFLEKVNVIGQLHVERATWANQLGELKAQAMVHRSQGASNENFEELVKEIEQQMAGISADITAHIPNSIAELHTFRDEIKTRLAAVGALYQQAYDSEEDILPEDLDLSSD